MFQAPHLDSHGVTAGDIHHDPIGVNLVGVAPNFLVAYSTKIGGVGIGRRGRS